MGSPTTGQFSNDNTIRKSYIAGFAHPGQSANHNEHLLVLFTVERNLFDISSDTLVISYVSYNGHYVKNMTASTKPEVHLYRNATRGGMGHCHTATRTKNLVKFGRIVFELCEQTDRHILIAINCILPGEN